MKSLLLVLTSLALLAPLGSAQSILSVDAGGGGDYLDIQSAVDAANPWDIVLVKAGTYTGFTIDAKSLVVAADSNNLVTISSPIGATNLAAGGEVVLQGLTMRPTGATLLVSLVSVTDCAGHVLLQELDGELPTGTITFFGVAHVENSTSVAIVNSRFDASRSTPSIAAGASIIQDSQVFLLGVTALGPAGINGRLKPSFGQDGGVGLELRGASALVVDCEIQGGDGAFGNPFGTPGDGGDGGSGILLLASAVSDSALVVYDSTLLPGAGGAVLAPAVPGVPGLPTEVIAGTVTTPAAFARSFTAAPVVRVGEQTTLTFSGQPFDLTWHIIGFDTNATTVYRPDILGAIHPGGTPLLYQFRGMLNGNGMKNLTFTLQPTGLDYVPVYEQALMYNATEGFVASNPAFVAIFDSTVP